MIIEEECETSNVQAMEDENDESKFNNGELSVVVAAAANNQGDFNNEASST